LVIYRGRPVPISVFTTK